MDIEIAARLKYLQRRQEEVLTLRGCGTTDETCEFAKKIGHQIKGNAISFGFPELTDIAIELEDAGVSGDQNRVLSLAQSLESTVKAKQADLTHETP